MGVGIIVKQRNRMQKAPWTLGSTYYNNFSRSFWNTYVFLTSIFLFFCLLSFRILHNNLLDLYLVEIRRYKLSFVAKEVTNTSHVAAPFLTFWKIVAWSSKLPGVWNYVHNWLNLLTSCGPNVGAIRRNAIFGVFFFFGLGLERLLWETCFSRGGRL